MRLLLLSNSTNHGAGYLDHAAGDVADFFRGVGRILFVPFALHDQESYWRRASTWFTALGIEVDPLREGPDAPRRIEDAAGIFVGGGNTFRLLERLQRCEAIDAIRRRAVAGIPYMGASAGTVIAAPTLRTTNDMPIVQPRSFDSLGLVPFQINCHYLDPDPRSTHMGETRETRILEFLEENDAVVVGLREGGILHLDEKAGVKLVLKGTAGARIFRRGLPPAEHAPGESLDQLLAS